MKSMSIWLALALTACGGGGTDSSDPSAAERIYLVPAKVQTSLPFDRVAIGYDASCMLTPDGQAWCWGNNAHGLLGSATTQTCSGGNVPCSWQAVRAQTPLRFAALSVGQLHACGLDDAGQARCWGFGIGGQLGDGRSRDSTAPVAVAGTHRFTQIDAGRSGLLSCALDDAGAAWCWGPAGGGALGNGTADMANVPTRVTSNRAFVSVGAGDEHACGLDAGGQAWCWGRNAYGKLGLGMPAAALRPAPVVGGQVFSALAVGGVFNCGLAVGGSAWCWGFAPSLGSASSQHRDVPTAVAGGHVFAVITAGYQNACGLERDGTAWCWGPAALDGSGSTTGGETPVAVAGGHRFRALQMGGSVACGITTAGEPWCWGFNISGAVGQSDVAN